MFELSKAHKLCSRTKINRLFDRGSSFVVYPLRVVYYIHPKEHDGELTQFFISVPKKRFKRAVKRVWLRRRIREAYRLQRHMLPAHDFPLVADVAFLYIASDLKEYNVIAPRMAEALQRLSRLMLAAPQKPQQES